MSGECQVNVKSQSELDIGGRETCQFSDRHKCTTYELSHLVSVVLSRAPMRTSVSGVRRRGGHAWARSRSQSSLVTRHGHTRPLGASQEQQSPG